jgi:hypothetical protein
MQRRSVAGRRGIVGRQFEIVTMRVGRVKMSPCIVERPGDIVAGLGRSVTLRRRIVTVPGGLGAVRAEIGGAAGEEPPATRRCRKVRGRIVARRGRTGTRPRLIGTVPAPPVAVPASPVKLPRNIVVMQGH